MTDTQQITIKNAVLIQSQHDVHLCLPLTDKKKQISYKCPLCNFVTPVKGRLKNHVLVHTHHKPYKCDICHYHFTQLSEMKCHFRVKHSEIKKPYRCDDCNMAFDKRWALKRHRLYRHINIKPHKCTECDYRCVQVSALRRHMRIHSRDIDDVNMKRHKCTECEYSCDQMSTLRRHMRIHRDIKPKLPELLK